MDIPNDQPRAFLKELVGTAENLFFYLWSLRRPDQEKLTWWYPTDPSGIDEAADKSAVLSQSNCDVYVGVSLHKRQGGPHDRAKAELVDGIVGLYLDIDVAGEGHKKKGLPPSVDDARRLLEETYPQAPTIVIDSGHGLQAWFLFKEPWLFASADERNRAAAVSKGLNARLIRAASKRGWSADNVGDLARVLRVPGTLNHKTSNPVPVLITEWRA
jgi:hypothetical protein